VEFHDAYFLASQRVGVAAIAAGDIAHRGEHAIAVARQPFRGFAAEAARCAGDENSPSHDLPPFSSTRDDQDRNLGGWTSGVVRRARPIVRTGAHRPTPLRRRRRDLGGVIGRDAALPLAQTTAL